MFEVYIIKEKSVSRYSLNPVIAIRNIRTLAEFFYIVSDARHVLLHSTLEQHWFELCRVHSHMLCFVLFP